MTPNDLPVNPARSVAPEVSKPPPPPLPNALGSPRSSSGRRRHRRGLRRFIPKAVRRVFRWQIAVVVVLVALIIPSAVAVAFVADANARVQDSWTSLRRVLTSLRSHSLNELNQSEVDRLQFSLNALASDLQRARQQTRFLMPVANYNADLKGRLALLSISDEIGQAAQDAMAGLRPAFVLLLTDNPNNLSLPIESADRVVELLRAGQGQFLSADKHLAAAQSQIAALDMAALSPDLLLTTQEIIQYHRQFDALNKILIDSPDLISNLLGLNDGKNYLILSENSDEIRPSGGYISTFGYMRVRRGQLVDFGYSPTTATSPNPPPDDKLTDLKIPDWWIHYKNPIYTAWDGSWYADFSATAKLAAWFYDSGLNPRSPVNGVIGIDIVGFEYMLSGIGGVTVPDYNEQVTADNFREVIYRIREGEGEAPHKAFLAALYKQILANWQTASQQQGNQLFSAVLRALAEKHIMLYFPDEKLGRAVSLLGWDGAQAPAKDQDYLMVADTNLGNKSNSSINRQLTYDVEIQSDGSLKSRASISYDYSAAVASKDPAVAPRNYTDINYFNIMQVFTPAGAKLTDTKNLQAKVDTDAGTTMTNFITLTEVKYDSTQRYQISYTSPPLVSAFGPYHRYRLLLQKQPGMVGERAEVQVTLPAGAALISSSPASVANYNLGQAVYVFRVQLTTDQTIEVIYSLK